MVGSAAMVGDALGVADGLGVGVGVGVGVSVGITRGPTGTIPVSSTGPCTLGLGEDEGSGSLKSLGEFWAAVGTAASARATKGRGENRGIL